MGVVRPRRWRCDRTPAGRFAAAGAALLALLGLAAGAVHAEETAAPGGLLPVPAITIERGATISQDMLTEKHFYFDPDRPLLGHHRPVARHRAQGGSSHARGRPADPAQRVPHGRARGARQAHRSALPHGQPQHHRDRAAAERRRSGRPRVVRATSIRAVPSPASSQPTARSRCPRHDPPSRHTFRGGAVARADCSRRSGRGRELRRAHQGHHVPSRACATTS